jgi:beta-glucosidase
MHSAVQRTEDGFTYRDLNKNGRLDVYEDVRRPVQERVDDLLAQMTLEEKAGLMFHMIANVSTDGTLDGPSVGFSQSSIREMIEGLHMSHFNIHAISSPETAAQWHNEVQRLAESSRLGIPVTISSDPRHAFANNPATNFSAGAFSAWPEPLGLAATGDAALVERFGDIARQEYTAIGIRVALHPMADLATEPRWSRINGTFGEDAELSARLTAAYIRGFQGAELGPASVACMTKHFPGGGPQKDGEDPHFSYGREQVYPGDNWDYHLIPFEAAFEADTAQIMPYYGMPIGTAYEEVGFGFNKQVITGLLRERYGFDGVVCTDWMLLTGIEADGRVIIEAKAWGVEHLSVAERARKAIDAGCDQFGGERCPEVVVQLVRDGLIDEARIDQSVRRLLCDKFRLGLFDNPFVDPATATSVVGSAPFREAGIEAQRRSMVLLKNGGDAPVLPLRGKPRVYVEGVDRDLAGEYGEVVDDVAEADVAILRLAAPYEPREGFLERLFHAGSLAFGADEVARLQRIMQQVPTVVDIYLERPAVIPEIAADCAALLGNFGAHDRVVLDLIWGRYTPTGKLPFELPSSLEAVERQHPDVPYDSDAPLFAFGYGLGF